MSNEVVIDPSTGHVEIGGKITLFPNQILEQVRELLINFSTNERDLKTGYVWLDVNKLLFGMETCVLSICFHQLKLTSISWNINLPNAETEGNWPTRKAIDEEIIFVRSELLRQLGSEVPDKGLEFSWGNVWSVFDPKGFLAGNGLRYT